MVVDIGEVRKYIKPKADSTLYNMRKVDLIDYVRTLEHNYNVAVSFNENQAKYIESLGFTGLVRCKDCKWRNCKGDCEHKYWQDAEGWDKCVDDDGFCHLAEREIKNENRAD